MNRGKLRKYQTILRGQLEVLEHQSAGTVSDMVEKEGAALRPDPNDRATVEADRNFDLRLRDRDRKLIGKIKEALARIEAGSYGRCEECGARIDDRRLRARPVTTQCIECKEDSERRERRE